MMELNARGFESFFTALWGYTPFPWQMRLVRRVLETGSWPEALAVPTGAGKTACIDIAVYALACQAALAPAVRTAPRRIFFVVDRRIIVDEAYERACLLAQRLRDPQDKIVRNVAERLRDIGGGDQPLACFQLRGGVYRDDAWARSPIQPTVVASTVDQVGSRLLFRGYGLRSGSMWPVHAGLVANDSLVILDEAHCARPFLQTSQAVQRYRDWRQPDGTTMPDNHFRLLVVSATPPEGVRDILQADENDRKDSVLGPRISAKKPAELVEAKLARGKHALEKLADTLTSRAMKLVNGDRQAVAIIVNRVESARQIYARLADHTDHDAILLTGRMRAIDRDEATRDLLNRLRTGQRRPLKRPLFVVATQTLEVGANLDFDALVSECASLDALRQRFGRLNREGRPIDARACIIIRRDQVKEEKNEERSDPVYGNALPRTWSWLKKHATDGTVDFSIESLDQLLAGASHEQLRALSPPAPDAPVMLPAHIDCWCQTWPTPMPDPDVALFLHGPRRTTPEVQICWRADLRFDPEWSRDEYEEQGAWWTEVASHCPPSSVETMPVPLTAVRRWLAGDDSRLRSLSDVESVTATDEDIKVATRRGALRWLGPEDSHLLTGKGDEIRPGDTLVLPANQGGQEIFGHVPPGVSLDRGDEAHFRARALPVVRVSKELLASWPECPAREALLHMAATKAWPEEDADPLALLEEVAANEGAPAWLGLAVSALRAQRNRLEVVHRPERGWLALRGKCRTPTLAKIGTLLEWTGNETFSDEDDSSSATVDVELTEHVQGVADFARCYAAKAGLSPALIEDLTLAGLFHDLGKADPRFQAMLHGGNPWIAQAAGQLLAKSGGMPVGRHERERARAQSGYPKGGRHELLSVRLAEGSGQLARAHDPDLVLHLIASHHGRCRPFAPIVTDPGPQAIHIRLDGEMLGASSATGLERLDSGVSERFWRLIRRYGWWHLAWLEAILRLADHRRSEQEQRAAARNTDTEPLSEIA